MQEKVPMMLTHIAQRYSVKQRWSTFSVVLIFAFLITMLPSAALASTTAASAKAPYYNGVYYRVQRGDTLSEIAVWHGTTVRALMYANGISNPNHIYVGQKLYIPSGYSGGYPGGHHDDGHQGGPVGGPQCAFYHTVQYGQSLAAIANYYGVNAWTLAQINAIYNPNHIYAGQLLCIPGGYAPPPPKPHKPPPPKPQPQPPGQCTYVVRPGDTLAKIAYWYGTTVNTLVYLNNLYNVNQLYVGQVLYVPGQSCPGPNPPEPPKPPVDAWDGVYFNNKYLEGAPAFTRQDGSINFDWAGGGPGSGVGNDQFSVAWSRTAYFQTGTYRFYATVDDGVRVYVDGHLIIDSWREQPATSYFGDIYLGEGNHALRVEYYEEGGGASVRVWWNRL